LAFFVYGIGGDFWSFLVAELILAVSISLVSGADQAFLFDLLKEENREKEFGKIFGNLTFISIFAIGVANAFGGIIGQHNLRLAVFVSVPFFILSTFFALTLKEPKRTKLVIKKGYLKELLNIVKKALFENPKLRWLILFYAVIYSFNQSALWIYQPYFAELGIEVFYFGFIFASFQAVAAIASKYSSQIESWVGRTNSLLLIVLGLSLSYFLMGNVLFWFSFAFAFLQQFIRSFIMVVFSDYINQLTKSENRATILSVNSMMARLVYAGVVFTIGVSMDSRGVVNTLNLVAIASLIAGLSVFVILMWVLRRRV
jgi:MFS family permease